MGYGCSCAGLAKNVNIRERMFLIHRLSPGPCLSQPSAAHIDDDQNGALWEVRCLFEIMKNLRVVAMFGSFLAKACSPRKEAFVEIFLRRFRKPIVSKDAAMFPS